MQQNSFQEHITTRWIRSTSFICFFMYPISTWIVTIPLLESFSRTLILRIRSRTLIMQVQDYD